MVIALPYRAPRKLLNFTLQKGDGFSRIHIIQIFFLKLELTNFLVKENKTKSLDPTLYGLQDVRVFTGEVHFRDTL